MREVPRKCIRLTEGEQVAKRDDLDHYKVKLWHTTGGGTLSARCEYDFNRGWEYALGRLRGLDCMRCVDRQNCVERNA